MDRLPGVEYAAPPVTTNSAAPLAWPPRLIVIHDTGNPSSTRYGEASYAHTRSLSGATSAHFYVDTGGVLGSLSLGKCAWAAYGYANRNGIHIEMCGMNTGTAHAVPAATIARTAALVRQLCDVAGIPAVKLTPSEVAAGKRGICGHWDITTGLGVGDHDDPGPAFDWPTFMRQINGAPVAPSTRETKMFLAVRTSDGTVMRCDGMRSVPFTSEDDFNNFRTLVGEGLIKIEGTTTPRKGWYEGAFGYLDKATGPAVDVQALAAALAPLLQVPAADVLGVLQSSAGQEALARAAEYAEDH